MPAELGPISAVVPGWDPGNPDSLRKAAINQERDHAQGIMHQLALVLASHHKTDRRLVRHAITCAVLEPLQGHERRDAQAFLNRLSWPH